MEISSCGKEGEAATICKANSPMKDILFVWLTQSQVVNTWLEANSTFLMAEMRTGEYKITIGTIPHIPALLSPKPNSATILRESSGHWVLRSGHLFRTAFFRTEFVRQTSSATIL